MKRVIIKNRQGLKTHGADLENAETDSWVLSGVSGNWWGLAERWKWKEECTEEELTTVLEEREVEISQAIPEVPESTRTRYLLQEEPELWKFAEECTEEEISSAIRSEEIVIPSVPAVPSVTKTEVRLAATYTIEIIDIDNEVQQETQRLLQMRNLKQRLKELDAATDLTAAEVKEAIRKFIKLMILRKDFD